MAKDTNNGKKILEWLSFEENKNVEFKENNLLNADIVFKEYDRSYIAKFNQWLPDIETGNLFMDENKQVFLITYIGPENPFYINPDYIVRLKPLQYDQPEIYGKQFMYFTNAKNDGNSNS